ncbi:formate dehydrogenase subunit gamma [Schlegelella sp. ID0723]|uniref:Formate dehydrogenase subunit gamma n=2 Tax=Piscinibacter koreensis TaxID=2742824 RepID=A0A7Y6NPD6_9BURK|nr:formate dehydrogenase subunit gamma [Schlegelella koreensis]
MPIAPAPTGAAAAAVPAPAPPAAATLAPPATGITRDARGDIASATASSPGIAGSYVIPAEPRADESNAVRARTQPGNNAPFWRQVRNSGNAQGTVNLPGAERGVLVQAFTQYPGSRYTTAGEAWRQVRNNWIIPYGGALIVITVFALGIFYWRRGPIGGHEPHTGRVIERFTPFERAAHWANALAFVVLAISGMVMAFGKFVLLPLTGSVLFGWLTYALKTVHNFVGPLFVVSLLVMIVGFIRSNLPARGDLHWIRRGGGLFGGAEPPSHRFNAGEKLVFWFGVLLLGLVVVASGLALDMLLPGLAYTRGDMHVAHMIHAVAAALMIAVFLGHIYLGTIGMRGAYAAMKTGYVDEGWAEAHHRYWYDDIRAGKIPAERSRRGRGGRVEQPAA